MVNYLGTKIFTTSSNSRISVKEELCQNSMKEVRNWRLCGTALCYENSVLSGERRAQQRLSHPMALQLFDNSLFVGF